MKLDLSLIVIKYQSSDSYCSKKIIFICFPLQMHTEAKVKDQRNITVLAIVVDFLSPMLYANI